MITWILGSGGLLGSALARLTTHHYSPGPVPWADPAEAAATLRSQARDFEAATEGAPWRVIWAAGAATTSTPRDQALSELVPLQGLLSGLRSALPSGPGTFFLTSSAGGVYAGSSNPPFTTSTTPFPLSAYGELKLEQESLVAEALTGLTPAVIGRISNLYGPGQNLTKLQGLISRLALSAIHQEPVNIFVPLDTIRDYLYSDDAARTILRLTAQPPKGTDVTTEILATGRATTIGQLIRTMNEISKRRVPVALGSDASAQAQALDLRVEPSLELDRVTTLPAGMKAVHDDILARVQGAR